jgi:hypothetical protein
VRRAACFIRMRRKRPAGAEVPRRIFGTFRTCGSE